MKANLLNLASPIGLFRFLSETVKIREPRKTALRKNQEKQGRVYLVGAGPGDPELLTLKAYKVIQNADVLLIDWLVAGSLYEYFPRHAEQIFVGKKCGQHSMSQQEINDLFVLKAQQGLNVVRIKGGDPSIFGRLAEECDALAKAKIPFAVIPGVTAASGCAAYTGIPLTHRECSQSVKFVTARVKSGQVDADWRQLAKDACTLVFYMGLANVRVIQRHLHENGMDGNCPIAVIDQGTTTSQKIEVSTIADRHFCKKLRHFEGPAIIIIGEVVSRRQPVNVDILLSHASCIA